MAGEVSDTAEMQSSLGAALLHCDACERETLHRILRLDRTSAARAGRSLRGVARCRVCRWTHPFVSTRDIPVTVEVVVSHGAESRRLQVEMAPTEVLRVGARLPVPGPELTVRRIDRRDREGPAPAIAREVRTVWAVESGPSELRVAVQEGARSKTERLLRTPGLRLVVGASLALPSGPVTIVGLRAQGRTWRRLGDTFAAEEVRVVYGRRSRNPPAGSSPWRRVRGTPSSRESSSSTAGRSRSSPGARRNRTAPRARSAAGGATERSSSSR